MSAQNAVVLPTLRPLAERVKRQNEKKHGNNSRSPSLGEHVMKKKCISQFLLLKLCNVNESSFTRPTLLGEVTVPCNELVPTVKKDSLTDLLKDEIGKQIK